MFAFSNNGFKNLGIYEKLSILDFETNCNFLKLYFSDFLKKCGFFDISEKNCRERNEEIVKWIITL